MKHVFIVTVPFVRFNLDALEDIMDGIIHYAITGNRDILDQEIDGYCDLIPDSDTAAFETEEYRRFANEAANLYAPIIYNGLTPDKLAEVTTLLKSFPVSEVNITDKTELVFEIDDAV